MSNEAKGPYTVQTYDDGFIVVSPAGKVVYSNHYKGDCDRQCRNFNEAVSSALTSQAARVRELEELLALCKDVIDDDLENRAARHSLGRLHAACKAALTPKEATDASS